MLRVLFTYRIDRVMEIEKMITKKEDLMNTYIRNDNGELLELYIASCLEFGFHLSPAFNDSKLLDDKFMFIATGIDGDSVWAVNNRYDAMTSQITISDLKPRTKTEFVKCEFEHAWEALKAFEDGEDLFRDKNQTLNTNAVEFVKAASVGGIGYILTYYKADNLYRKVETEIDERQEFIDECQKYGSWEAMYDSGKFKLVEK